ncbi:MAG TPA: NADH-quinone oxidoreductase subunit J, partial [Oceanospirillales bacterium]|nr:NADH-quinone oxidoreductase subunit J [Oceanospirillales bacterium]
NDALLREGFTKYLIPGGLVAIVIIVEMAIVVGPENFGLDKFADPVARAADYSNTKELGMLLYTDYVYPFELAAVLLLVAIIAAISLTMRRRPQTKYQDPAKQILVRREDRVRVVKMESEKIKE